MASRCWNHSIDVKWGREWDINRVRVTESVGARRVGPAPTYPTLTAAAAAACRERSAAFPEGNAEEGGRGSLLFRSPHSIKQTKAATWEGRRQATCFRLLILQKEMTGFLVKLMPNNRQQTGLTWAKWIQCLTWMVILLICFYVFIFICWWE